MLHQPFCDVAFLCTHVSGVSGLEKSPDFRVGTGCSSNRYLLKASLVTFPFVIRTLTLVFFTNGCIINE